MLLSVPANSTSITSNATFAANYAYTICPYDANSTLKSVIWNCAGSSTPFGPIPILVYCSSDLNSPSDVCSIPQFTANNCPNLAVALSCATRTSGAKFYEQATGPGVFNVQGTLALSPSPSPTPAGSNKTLLYLLFLLFLIPLGLLLVWLWSKRRGQKALGTPPTEDEEGPAFPVVDIFPDVSGPVPSPAVMRYLDVEDTPPPEECDAQRYIRGISSSAGSMTHRKQYGPGAGSPVSTHPLREETNTLWPEGPNTPYRAPQLEGHNRINKSYIGEPVGSVLGDAPRPSNPLNPLTHSPPLPPNEGAR